MIDQRHARALDPGAQIADIAMRDLDLMIERNHGAAQFDNLALHDGKPLGERDEHFLLLPAVPEHAQPSIDAGAAA
jgi:hypothetical protein